ncbi:MAG: NADH-quinone oxidoreductase subunit NuoE [Halanaerobiaceae bacterium]
MKTQEKDLLLEKLHNLQDTYGYIPEGEIDRLAQEFDTPRAKIYGVIRFYSMFYTEPTGKYIIRVCDSLSCHINQSEDIVKTITDYLEIEDGETTDDKKFTLEIVECLGHCDEGPVMMVNDEIYTHLNSGRTLDILRNCT